MKKTYMKPETVANDIELQTLVCVSIVEGQEANPENEVLTKERGTRNTDTSIDGDEVLQSVEAQPQYGDLW